MGSHWSWLALAALLSTGVADGKPLPREWTLTGWDGKDVYEGTATLEQRSGKRVRIRLSYTYRFGKRAEGQRRYRATIRGVLQGSVLSGTRTTPQARGLSAALGRTKTPRGTADQVEYRLRRGKGGVELFGVYGRKSAELLTFGDRPGFVPWRWPEPDLARTFPRWKGKPSIPLPVFVIPRQDLRGSNGLLAVIVDDSQPDRVTFTAIFRGEDAPAPLLDMTYDSLRWLGYRRVMDLEALTYHYARGRPTQVEFAGDYAKDQRFDTPIPWHHSATIPWSKFGLRGKRPEVHVNTWNHLLSHRNTNPKLKLMRVADYPVYRGTRKDAQALFERFWWVKGRLRRDVRALAQRSWGAFGSRLRRWARRLKKRRRPTRR